jgi:hypothetical protein
MSYGRWTDSQLSSERSKLSAQRKFFEGQKRSASRSMAATATQVLEESRKQVLTIDEKLSKLHDELRYRNRQRRKVRLI